MVRNKPNAMLQKMYRKREAPIKRVLVSKRFYSCLRDEQHSVDADKSAIDFSFLLHHANIGGALEPPPDREDS